MNPEPLIRIVRGNATADEVAAITAVLLSLKVEPTTEVAARSRWADRTRLLRRPLQHQSGSWKHWSA